jgi:hypothetical protein
MMVREAQREMRRWFLGGFAGQLVSGALWLISSACATWSGRRTAMLVLVVGGFFIFPLTQLVLRAMGRTGPRPANPLDLLGMQVAFTVPLGLPLVGAAALQRADWFYPAFMIVVGAHYLPFVFLYGMPQFAVLCGLLVFGGVGIGLWTHGAFALGGWLTGALLVAFAFVGRAVAAREAARG